MAGRGRPGKAPQSPEDRPIPKKHLRFLRLYQTDKKPGRQCAIEAGYPASSADQQSHFILSRPNCKRWLAEQEKAAMERHGITMDQIVRELAKVGFSNMADYIEDDGSGKPMFRKVGEISRDHMAAVTELTLDIRKEFEGRGEDRAHVADVEKIKFKLASKVDGLVKLGQMLGHFPKGDGGGDGSESPNRTVTIRVVGGLPQPPKDDEDG